MTLQRIVAAIGGRRVLLLLGGAFVGLAIANPIVLAADGTPPGNVLVQFVLIAGPGFVLLFGAHRLVRSDVHPDFYPTVATYAIAGPVVMAALLVVYDLQPAGGIAHPEAAVPILLALGSVAGYAAGVHDARARTQTRVLRERNAELQSTKRELEATVTEVESSNERLEQFASAVSHDLQEPLRMVTTYLQLLERHHAEDVDDEAEEFVEIAVDGAQRMHEMIDGLLAYARVESEGEPLEPVALDRVLAEVRDDLRVRFEEHDAEVTVDDLPTVLGDERQLRQVFQNLLDNGVEYSGDEPPRIEVFTASDVDGTRKARSDADSGTVAAPGAGESVAPGAGESAAVSIGDVTTVRAADLVTIAVRDHGIGMDPEYADRAFEVFHSLQEPDEHEGTGLGLALVERIVARHGGEVWVDAEPGEGSTFYVSLPRATRAAASARSVRDDGLPAARDEDGSNRAVSEEAATWRRSRSDRDSLRTDAGG